MLKLVTHKLVGKEINDDFLTELLNRKPSTMGVAWRGPNGKLEDIKIPAKVTALDLASLKQFFQGETKDRFIMSWFATPRPTLEEDMQPFVVCKNAKDEPLIMAMLEGEFPAVTDSAHTGEYHVAMDKIAPRMDRLNRLLKGDGDAMAVELYDMVPELGELIPTKGSISLLVNTPKDVVCITSFKSEEAGDVSFGWSSSDLLKVKPAGAVNKMTDALSSLKEKFLGGGAEAKAPVTALSEGSKLVSKGTSVEFEGKDVTFETLMSSPWCRNPPAHFKKEREIKNWYKNYAGYVPNEWENRVPVLSINAQKAFKELSKKQGLDVPEVATFTLLQKAVGDKVEQPSTKADPPTAEKVETTVVKTQATEPAKELTTQEKIAAIKARNAAKSKTEQKDDSILSREGVIPPNVRETISKGWLKTAMDENGVDLPFDPAQIKKLEADKPQFTESLGIKGLSPLYRTSDAMLLKLIKEQPNEAMMLLRESLLANWFKDAVAIKTQEKKGSTAKVA